MEYESSLSLFRKIMDQLKLPHFAGPLDMRALESADMGLRAALGVAQQSHNEWSDRMRSIIRDQVIYYITDEFSFRYVVMLLPAGDERRVLTIGPYMIDAADTDYALRYVEQNGLNPDWVPILRSHYLKTTYLDSEHSLIVSLRALAEQLWGPHQFTTERITRGIPDTWAPLTDSIRKDHGQLISEVSMIEKRYRSENDLMQAVSQGRVQKAQLMLSGFAQAMLDQRTEPVRNTRNYTIILNTLLRKAAEQGGVHPLYIDRISTEFALAIEDTSDWADFKLLWAEMARKYCLLVRKHNTKEYSTLVQQVIARVDFDLTADLSLKATAQSLNVNASYLSSLFKKETGMTVTAHVHQKRMEHAAYLLSNTQLPISEVAQSCGIQDDNYFTKVFKSYAKITPKQFRQQNYNFKKK